MKDILTLRNAPSNQLLVFVDYNDGGDSYWGLTIEGDFKHVMGVFIKLDAELAPPIQTKGLPNLANSHFMPCLLGSQIIWYGAHLFVDIVTDEVLARMRSG